MSFRLQAGTDSLLLQDGTDKLLLQDEVAGPLSISVGAGTVTISGYDPNVGYVPRLISLDRVITRRVSVGSGVHRQDIYIRQKVPFRIYEQEATEESVEVSVSAGAGSVLIQGVQADTFAEQVIPVGAGAVTIEGNQPSEYVELEIPVGAGTVTIDGAQTSSYIELDIVVGAGLVAISGAQVIVSVPGVETVLPGSGVISIDGSQITTDITLPTEEGDRLRCGPNLLWSFFFNDGTTQQKYSGGGSEDLIQLRLREDEELLRIIQEFVRKAA